MEKETKEGGFEEDVWVSGSGKVNGEVRNTGGGGSDFEG